MRTLLITNDFPPRTGGIQIFVHELATRLPAGELVVYSSDWRGSAEFDAQQPFPVIRENTKVLLPTRGVARRAAALAAEHGCDRVWFGAAAPLGLLAGGLNRRAVALTHGHEVGWAALPFARNALRRIADRCEVITYLTEYQRQRLAPIVGDRAQLQRLTPAVDTGLYHPGVDGSAIRAAHGLSDRPVIVCVSRFVPRKGQDTLVRALPLVRKEIPDAALLLVGGGPHRNAVRKLVSSLDLEPHVVMAGSVPWAQLPAHYAAGDVFAMPCRTRNRGLDVEGLGIVYLEASAIGLPVVAGDSGGAPDAVREGETGFVVGGRDLPALADRLVTLLRDPALARKMGAAGRDWIESDWTWAQRATALRGMLAG
ncbi:GDP-mannose-dependent alpha-(1-6)-phosphatidylinositol monomannoside mannosyltransferase [Rhizocola hellebori]|uniref:GDP-mannose-dependent alpha-(1-6)-phosphatidylinositol monomannoside mannosyltransferase n=1 Tax=Rhizocola hellebori TaxID=1392758 RepID=A0A8J3VKA1_9ACTN|nr:GDP-mannose-dependent alpha-(1-6)-phosphatidylinositol monomannoside mannosyltransferase [Rhizocola hellebori]